MPLFSFLALGIAEKILLPKQKIVTESPTFCAPDRFQKKSDRDRQKVTPKIKITHTIEDNNRK